MMMLVSVLRPYYISMILPCSVYRSKLSRRYRSLIYFYFVSVKIVATTKTLIHIFSRRPQCKHRVHPISVVVVVFVYNNIVYEISCLGKKCRHNSYHISLSLFFLQPNLKPATHCGWGRSR